MKKVLTSKTFVVVIMIAAVVLVSVATFFAINPINAEERVISTETTSATQAAVQKETYKPTTAPTQAPTQKPTQAPTQKPTQAPTQKPTQAPAPKPTQAPAPKPTQAPAPKPTQAPAPRPTQAPAPMPTVAPTEAPTAAPTEASTVAPTEEPTKAEPSELNIELQKLISDCKANGYAVGKIIGSDGKVTESNILIFSFGKNASDKSYKLYKIGEKGAALIGTVKGSDTTLYTDKSNGNLCLRNAHDNVYSDGSIKLGKDGKVSVSYGAQKTVEDGKFPKLNGEKAKLFNITDFSGISKF